jgi:phosphoribosylformylglycinamidine cyclo-ligase
MGAGFALFTASGSGRDAVEAARAAGHAALLAGRVEEGPRQVVLEPIEVTYRGDELDVR